MDRTYDDGIEYADLYTDKYIPTYRDLTIFLKERRNDRDNCQVAAHIRESRLLNFGT